MLLFTNVFTESLFHRSRFMTCEWNSSFFWMFTSTYRPKLRPFAHACPTRRRKRERAADATAMRQWTVPYTEAAATHLL